MYALDCSSWKPVRPFIMALSCLLSQCRNYTCIINFCYSYWSFCYHSIYFTSNTLS